jgi:hypothetical protein
MDLPTLQDIATSNDPTDGTNPVGGEHTDHASSQTNEPSLFLNRPFTMGQPEEEIIFSDVPPMTQFSWDHDDNVSVLSTPGLGAATKRQRSDPHDAPTVKRGRWNSSDSSHSTSRNRLTLGTLPLSSESKRKRAPSVTGPRKKSKPSRTTPSVRSSPPSSSSGSSRSALLFTSSTHSTPTSANLFPDSDLFTRSSLPSRSGFSTRSGYTRPLYDEESQSSLPSHQTGFSQWTPLSSFRQRTTDTITEPGYYSQSSSISSNHGSEPHTNLVWFTNKRKRDLDESFQRRTRQRTPSTSSGSFSIGTFSRTPSHRPRTYRNSDAAAIRPARFTAPRRNNLQGAVKTFPTKNVLTLWNPRRPTRYDSITQFPPSPTPEPRYQLTLPQHQRHSDRLHRQKPLPALAPASQIDNTEEGLQRFIDDYETLEPSFWTDRLHRNKPLNTIPEAPYRPRFTRQAQSRLDDIDPVPQDETTTLTGKRNREEHVHFSGNKKQKPTPSAKRQRDNHSTFSRNNKKLKPTPLTFAPSTRQRLTPTGRPRTRPRPEIPRSTGSTSSSQRKPPAKKRKSRSDFPNNYLYMLHKYKYKKEDEDDDEERFII